MMAPINTEDPQLGELNKEWRFLLKGDVSFSRRRWEEDENVVDWSDKKKRFFSQINTGPLLKGREGKRVAKSAPGSSIFGPLDTQDGANKRQRTDPPQDDKLRPSLLDDLLAQDPLDFESLGALVLSTPLHFELVRSGAFMSKAQLEACFKLVERTSSDAYKAASAGWHPKAKKEEMADKEMGYLLVKTAAKEARILGFISFMATCDEPPRQEREVVYMYEIHLDESLRGCGLGSKLIRFVELVALKLGIFKTMLTVFRTNAGARALYERLGYSRDSSSPEDRVVRKRVIEAEYLIMSKVLVEDY
jgi:ribosomal protein S18 acetylase RimI-like enzyme